MDIPYNIFWIVILVSLIITLIRYKKAWSYIENLRLNKREYFFIAVTVMIILVFIYLGWSYVDGTKPTFEFFTAVGTIGAAWAATYGAHQASKIAKKQVDILINTTTLDRFNSFNEDYKQNISFFKYSGIGRTYYVGKLNIFFELHTNPPLRKYYFEIMLTSLDTVKSLIHSEQGRRSLFTEYGVESSLDHLFDDILDLSYESETPLEERGKYIILMSLNEHFIKIKNILKKLQYERDIVMQNSVSVENNNHYLLTKLTNFVELVEGERNIMSSCFEEMLFLISERYFDSQLIELGNIDKEIYFKRNTLKIKTELEIFGRYLSSSRYLVPIEARYASLDVYKYLEFMSQNPFIISKP